MSTIWIQEAPSGLEMTEERIQAMWPPYTLPSRAVRISPHLNYGWLDNSAGSQLQRFSERLIGELRYQTCELFLAPPFQDPKRRGTPSLVAAAFRKTDNCGEDSYGPDKQRKRPTGVYSFSHNTLTKLRRIVTCGEPMTVLKDRIHRFQNSTDGGDALVRHVRYVAMGTVVAYLARMVPEEHRHVGRNLWKLVREFLGKRIPDSIRGPRSQGRPPREVRSALAELIAVDGLLLLEGRPQEELINRALRRHESLDSVKEPQALHFEQALDLWALLSDEVDAFGRFLQQEAWNLHVESTRLLFEAQIRSYPHWLNSATLGAERAGHPVVYGDLRALLAAGREQRNQKINVASLEGYERAARKLLLNALLPGTGRRSTLKNMMLIPIDFREGDTRYSGILRFMNRFERSNDTLRLYTYSGSSQGPNGPSWSETDEEKLLAIAVLGLLRKTLPRLLTVVGLYDTSLRKEVGTLAINHSRNLGLVGQSRAIDEVREKIRQYAAVDEPLLITGATGCGKGVVAKAIHDLSSRQDKKWIAVNLQEIPANLFESEIFGIGGGVATEVRPRKGLLEQAQGGTLFLDEIGELDEANQIKLLRVLEQGYVTPIGTEQEIPIDVRFIFATNKDLKEAVAFGTFRSDLLYRIWVVAIRMPTLAERGGDCLSLLEHFLRDGNCADLPSFSEDALEYIRTYEWPGNVRELKNFSKRVQIDYSGRELSANDVEKLLRL